MLSANVYQFGQVLNLVVWQDTNGCLLVLMHNEDIVRLVHEAPVGTKNV